LLNSNFCFSTKIKGFYMRICLALFALIIAITLTGCTTAPTQEQQGMVIGGVLGGVIGSTIGGGRGRVIAASVGTLIGAIAGGAIGKRLDEADRLKTGYTLETVRTGVSSEWVNPDTGTNYKVTPTRTYSADSGTPCREFTMEAEIGGKTEQVYGTACRQADGSWKMRS
jgi:surface antigen